MWVTISAGPRQRAWRRLLCGSGERPARAPPATRRCRGRSYLGRPHGPQHGEPYWPRARREGRCLGRRRCRGRPRKTRTSPHLGKKEGVCVCGVVVDCDPTDKRRRRTFVDGRKGDRTIFVATDRRQRSEVHEGLTSSRGRPESSPFEAPEPRAEIGPSGERDEIDARGEAMGHHNLEVHRPVDVVVVEVCDDVAATRIHEELSFIAERHVALRVDVAHVLEAGER